jgi:hypothetical protein
MVSGKGVEGLVDGVWTDREKAVYRRCISLLLQEVLLLPCPMEQGRNLVEVFVFFVDRVQEYGT